MTIVGDDRLTDSLSFDTRSREQAIVRRLGMTCEGRIRDHVYTKGQWRDSLLYSVLVDEWSAVEPSGVHATPTG